MEKEDARKQSREVLHERRKQVIRMHRKGVAVMEIVAQTGLSWTAVNTALRLYKAKGSGALKPDALNNSRWILRYGAGPLCASTLSWCMVSSCLFGQ